ncbi:MAG: dipeptide/oligopeptide/nickel ABC transporter ATP-binding protein [Phycisphaeraceae bacterium]|nr:dipeptide/oligopeptide/nickel ABC transporter ATP-binding protein [Phycisphaeraceae bacterium]
MQTEAPILSVRDLRVHFELPEGIVRAVDGVDFDLHAGRTLAIVGESGCGKTVTARAMLQLIDRPGRIVDGSMILRNGETETDIATLDPAGRPIRSIRGDRIALVFQEPMASFSPVHTIGSQIVEAIRLHRALTRAEAKAESIALLGHTGVPEPETRFRSYPHEMSGGLLQRAMIAMALSCRPDILIADEPTTALDVTTQAQILTLLKTLQRETNMAIIFITHDLGVVAQMADDVLVMYLGEVVEDGPVDAIFHHPHHPYTRAMLRSIPPIRSRARDQLETITGSIPHPLHRPEGCPFHDRCPDAIAGKCETRQPARTKIAEGHDVRCFLHEGTGSA